MRKIIAIVLAALLVAGGLGSLAYAQAESVNRVSAMFSTQWYYDVPGDTFTNDEVEGHEDFFAQMENDPDDTGANVTALTLTLDTETAFNFFQEENLVSEYPPPYEWDFGDVPEGSRHAIAWVGFRGVPQPVVPLTPGFDASRSVDITEFLQSEGTQTQIVTISVTPREKPIVTEGWLPIGVRAWENELVNAVINPPSTTEEFYLSPDGHKLDIHPTGLNVGEEWTITVEIDVTPKVPKVEFMPHVSITWWEPPSDSGTYSGLSLSYTVPEAGTWTWNAEGSYEWHWTYHMSRGLQWQPYSREIPVPHQPMTGQKLVGYGFYGTHDLGELDGATYHLHTMFTFTNPDGVSEITIERVSIFDRYGTVLYEGPLKPGTEERIMMPHQVDAVELHDYLEAGDLNPVTVEIFWTKSDKDGLPLTGWALSSHSIFDMGGNLVEASVGETQMVNMVQELKPKPKD